MAKPALVDNGLVNAPINFPIDLNAPFVVAYATNYGTQDQLDAAYFTHAAILARNLTESNYDGMRAVHIQVWDQRGQIAIDLQRVNANTFNVAYHPNLAFRFN